MFNLNFLNPFEKKYKKLTKKDLDLRKKVDKTLAKMIEDPYNPALKTRKVNTLNNGEQRSSRVTGDVRIIWNFDKNQQLVILVLDLGTHSGKYKVTSNLG